MKTLAEQNLKHPIEATGDTQQMINSNHHDYLENIENMPATETTIKFLNNKLNGQISAFKEVNKVKEKLDDSRQIDMRSKSSAPETDSKMEKEKLKIINHSVTEKESPAKLNTDTQSESKTADGAKAQPESQPPPLRAEPGAIKKFALDCLLYLVGGIITTYDLITWPIYLFRQGVLRRRREVDLLRSKKLDPNDPNSPWRQIHISESQIEIEKKIDSYETYDEMMQQSFKDNGPFICYGYRQIIEERFVKKPELGNKVLRQLQLSPYKWCTYGQFNEQIETVRKGLLRNGVCAGQKVILFADTRAEWQIICQALLRVGAVVCTMYSTLGIDGIIHTCNETKASLVITQHDRIERLLNLVDKLPHLKRIIYLQKSLHLPSQLGGDQQDDQCFNENVEECDKENQAGSKVECYSFAKLLALGMEDPTGTQAEEFEDIESKNRDALDKRDKDSLAVIMYTSGSTGIPKGVLISHGNIMATVKSFSYVTKDFVGSPRSNTCTAYLPLAHIFEFCIESVMLYHGVKFGFATPQTLTDKSPGLAPGQKGDLGLLKPTVMIIVPLILDRIVQGVRQALKSESYFKEQLVTYLIDYKSYWQKRHYETPLVDKLVCSKISQALGGQAKYVICGSAPLSSQTQIFIRSACNIKLPQGYGTTETCAATTCQLFDDQSTLNVGLPVAGAQIKLEPWHEGGYKPDDKPNPRGEIVVGGQMIAHGYFNLEDQTKEAFYRDEKGTRWYRTGDIGEFLPNGQLRIIDRKKDLVKLQNGEYISLGRVESTLKSNPFTDNFCVYANSNYNYVVALGPANEQAIKQLAQKIVDDYDKALSMSPMTAKRQGLPSSREERENLILKGPDDEQAMLELREILSTYESDSQNNNEINPSSKSLEPQDNRRLQLLCTNKLIVENALDHITTMAKSRNLLSLEVPKKLFLIPEEWTEDKNLVTAAMKIRRNFIYKRYDKELERLYSETTKA